MQSASNTYAVQKSEVTRFSDNSMQGFKHRWHFGALWVKVRFRITTDDEL